MCYNTRIFAADGEEISFDVLKYMYMYMYVYRLHVRYVQCTLYIQCDIVVV